MSRINKYARFLATLTNVWLDRKELEEDLGISTKTLYRYIGDARKAGADITLSKDQIRCNNLPTLTKLCEPFTLEEIGF